MLSTIKPPGLEDQFDAITSPHLRSAMFEKLDKNHFVKSFVDSQKVYATTYAANGEAKLSSNSWNDPAPGTPDKQHTPTHSSRDYGFRTPVLKARSSRPIDGINVLKERFSDIIDDASIRTIHKVSPKKPRENRILTGNAKTTKAPQLKYPDSLHQDKEVKPSSKKRTQKHQDSDHEEHVARMFPSIVLIY